MRGGHGIDLDFKRINEAALATPGFLQGRLPQAKRQGRELVAGDIHGNHGKSFSCNTETGAWSDFATGESGGDIISLVAAQEELGQAKAARMIAEQIGLAPVTPKPKRKDLPETPVRPENLVATFRYEDEAGRFLFAVDRYETPGCRKAIRQWHLDANGKRINSVKGVRLVPFRLPELLRAETVFIVEGEQKVLELAGWGLTATPPTWPCCAGPGWSASPRPKKAAPGPRAASSSSPAATRSAPASCARTFSPTRPSSSS